MRTMKHQPPTLIDVLVKNTRYTEFYEYVAVWLAMNLEDFKQQQKTKK